MRGIRKFFIAANTFLSHQIRISTTKACRTVFIMDVYHQPIISTLFHGFVHPFCPHLRTYLHKPKLNSRNSPWFIQRKYLIQLLLQSPLINIEHNSDAMLLRISNHFFQFQCIYFRIPTRIKCYSSGIWSLIILKTIPTGIKVDILQIPFYSKVYQSFSTFCGQGHFTHHFSRFNPGSILNPTWRIKI